MPRVVRSQDIRGRTRTSVEPRSGFRVHLRTGRQDGDFEVTDLSVRGLAFRTPAQGFPLFEGQLLKVKLTLPVGRPIKLEIRVANLRRDPERVGQRLVGTRIQKAPGDLSRRLEASLKRVA